MGITADYINFCLGLRYKDLPAEVVERVKRLALDFTGSTAYGVSADSSKALLQFLKAMNLRGDCTVIGTPMKCPPQYAALANGTFVKPNELDDSEITAHLHPGASVWPVIFALGEKYHLDGRELMLAGVLGYETIIRLGRAINPAEHYKRGFHPSSTCGTFAAAVAASKLLKLNRQQTTDALGIAGSQAAGSFRYIVDGAWTKALHSGWASHNGILAAHLAQKGFNGPNDIFEGKYGFFEAYSQNTDPELVMKDLGKFYWTLRTGIKIHAACRQEHPVLDVVLAIVNENDLKPEEIERVDLYMVIDAFKLVVEPEEKKRSPQNVPEAMHSIYFGVAMSVLRRSAFIEEHQEKWLRAPQVQDMIQKIFCHHDPALDTLQPEKFPARAVIQTRDGRTLAKMCDRPHGDGLDPLTEEELTAKYEALTRKICPAKRAKEIKAKIGALEQVKDFSAVTKLLARKGR